MTTLTPSADEAICFLGGSGTGKTEHLISRVAQLMTQGVAPSDICVLSASPDAAAAFITRLTHLLGEGTQGITITTPRDLALSILSSDEAKSFTGREPQLLANFEINFLMEDMKVSGLRPKRLREMLKFFYRSWSELADDDPTWLIIEEERGIHALIKENLCFTQGMMEAEVSNFAVNYLRSNKSALEAARFAHVLIDDYQAISRASQVLANLLAASSVAVAGNAIACVEVFESYPYAAGLDEFKERYPAAQTATLDTSFLSSAVTRAANALLADDCMKGASVPQQQNTSNLDNASRQAISANANTSGDAPHQAMDAGVREGTVSSESHDSVAEEFEAIAHLVDSKIKNEGISPADIFIAVPNKVWSKHVVTCLAHQGIQADALPAGQVLGGDIRDMDRSTSLRLYTALKLVANPHNAVAWRCWCGYGDYLTNSAAVSSLRSYASEAGLSLVEALEKITEDPCEAFSGSEKLASTYQSGKALINEVQGMTGTALLTALAQAVTNDTQASIPAVIEELCCPLGASEAEAATMIDAETAAELLAQAEQRLLSPQFSHAANAVKVAHARNTLGLSPAVLVFSGFVNGFIPARDYFDGAKTTLEKQEKMHVEDTKLLYSAISKAQRDLVLSSFKTIDLESAEMLNLKIDRIRLKNGERVCTISPSEYLSVICSQ